MQSSHDLQCRLCLSNIYTMHNFKENPKILDFEMTIIESVEDFFKIKISADDCSSKYICDKCLTIIRIVHMYRKRVQKCQNYRDPIEVDKRTIEEEENEKTLSHNIISKMFEREQSCVNQDWPEETFKNQELGNPKILVPVEYFNTKHPCVIISLEERNLANSVALQELQVTKKLEKKTRLIRVELKKEQECDNIKIGKLGKGHYVARNLVQEQISGNLYNDRCQKSGELSNTQHNKKMGIRKENCSPEELFYISMEINAFVCSICDEVFERSYDLRTHIKRHGRNIDAQ